MHKLLNKLPVAATIAMLSPILLMSNASADAGWINGTSTAKLILTVKAPSDISIEASTPSTVGGFGGAKAGSFKISNNADFPIATGHAGLAVDKANETSFGHPFMINAQGNSQIPVKLSGEGWKEYSESAERDIYYYEPEIQAKGTSTPLNVTIDGAPTNPSYGQYFLTVQSQVWSE
ncbi:hypothetical protein RYR42_002880 [Edwardsiella piscicida]|nr:hypothetical protein [Edwardsiella piscicida]